MSRRPRGLGYVLSLCILVPSIAAGQSPWTVTIKPSAVLPIGFCGNVQLSVLDPSRNSVPRNPLGYLVTIADFDMSVTSPDGKSVTGQRIDASHWSVCACQGATVGTVATIVATYPAQSLPVASRVPGVTLQATGTLTLGQALGSSNPSACTVATRNSGIAGAPLANAPAASAPATVAPAPVAPVTVANQPGRAAPVPALPPGPAPRNVTIAGTPVEAHVRWYPPTGTPAPTGYVVERWKASDPACCRATSPTLPHYSDRWVDMVVWSGVWSYQVTAVYADGRRGSTTGSYTYVEPETPTGLTARQTARNTVVLTWQPVQHASYYVVSGPPGNTAMRVNATTLTQTGVPVGSATWRVATMYEAKSPGAPQQTSPFATTTLPVVNPHYRLVAEAIRVTTETVDQPLSQDGKYDEVYVAALAETLDRQTGALTYDPVPVSHVHGDVAFWLPSERVQAGTASGFGGIRGGDVISPIWAAPHGTMLAGAPPFVLWDGELLPGRHDLLLHPTLWEVDEPDSYFARDVTSANCPSLCGWRNFLISGRAAHLGPVKAAMAASQISVVEGNRVWLGAHGELVHLENHNRDRPIGLENSDPAPGLMGLTGWMRDRVVVLNSEKIEAALASGKNTIEVRFWDHWTIPNTPPTTINYLNGDYTLVIRIERMP